MFAQAGLLSPSESRVVHGHFRKQQILANFKIKQYLK